MLSSCNLNNNLINKKIISNDIEVNKTELNNMLIIKDINTTNSTTSINIYDILEGKSIINKGLSNELNKSRIKKNNSYKYILHKNITATLFWVGEDSNKDNNFISNNSSCFDEYWLIHYGGVDNLNNIGENYMQNFKVKENPFYFALPISDYDENGSIRKLIKKIPWYNNSYLINGKLKKSVLKNKWIKIINIKNGKIAYAQWEDCGPFVYDDFDYVFGNKSPKNKLNNNAGIDLSPALTKYLNLSGMDKIDWKFVNINEVQKGPWTKIITRSQFCFENDCNYTRSYFNLNNSLNNSWYKPKIGISWQWQLNNCENLNTSYNVDLYDVDLFDTPIDSIKELHNRGIKVICYFSAGSYENWRNDSNDFPKEIIGNKLDGWDENWLNIRDINLITPIMKKRINLAVKKGCDGIEPDNIDAYINNNGFNLTYNDQLKYNKWLSKEAHNNNLSIALKNDLNQIKDLVNYFDFAINEQCFEYNECNLLLPFIKSNKAVLGVEYELDKSEFCYLANKMNFSWLKMNYNLDGKRDSCN